MRVQFRRTAAGRPLEMHVHDPWNSAPVFERVQLVTPAAAQLREYEGAYHSDELGVTYTFFVEKEKLWISGPDGKSPLEPSVRDAFERKGFRFECGPQGRVTAVILYSQRARNLPFARQRKPG